jgi:BarA-like signal transduction histidine kinase
MTQLNGLSFFIKFMRVVVMHVICLQDAKREHVDSLSSDNCILKILTLLHLFPLLAAQEES